MSEPVLSRRTLLLAATTALGLTMADVRAVEAALASIRSGGPLPGSGALRPDLAEDLAAIAERIFPADDSPGAREAGVPAFLDRALGTFFVSAKPMVESGLEDLNRRTRERWHSGGQFATLAPDQQDELLRTIETTPFFQWVRTATLCGMFADPAWGGNRDKAGWKLLGFEPRFVWQPPFGYYDTPTADRK
jgi:hypothetical protein